MRIQNHVVFFAVSLFFAMLVQSCAITDGDEVNCPVCDNKTEVLVGNKCVPLDQVDTCGPDGHNHGEECHCFSGQEPTEIGGTQYCLQQGCPGEEQDTDGDSTDLEQQACEHVQDTPEEVQAVSDFADFDQAHSDLAHLVKVELPSDSEGFIHFPGKKTGEVLVFVSQTGLIKDFLDADKKVLEAHNQGENKDCPESFKEVWQVKIINDSGTVKPQIIHFNKTDKSSEVKLLIL